MKSVKKWIAVCLMAACLCVCCTATAWADEDWNSTKLEQYTATVPEVTAYLYPLDSAGNIVYGLAESKLDIEAKLGNEKLRVVSFAPDKQEECMYIVLVNISSNGTGYTYLEYIKGELLKWIDGLNDGDKFALIAYADTATVLLDGTETRTAAVKMVESLKTAAVDADAVPAIKEALRLSQMEENALPGRHVMVMFDDGLFLEGEDMVLEELLDSLRAADLPVYALCNYPYSNIQYAMADFAESTGGRSFVSKGGTENTAAEELKTWLESCYVLKLRGESNLLLPRERDLTIRFGSADSPCNVEKTIQITDNIPDEKAPSLREVSVDDKTTISVVFTEKVNGAGSEKNYTVSEKKSGRELKIKEASYDEKTCTATLTMENKIPNGEYLLEIREITDVSNEANPFVYPDGAEEYSFTSGSRHNILLIVGICAVVLIAAAAAAFIIWKKKEHVEEPQEEPKINVRLTIITPDNRKENLDILVGNKFVIGRNAGMCDLVINDEKVSRSHMILSYTDGMLFLIDAGSSNGTIVNGMAVDKQRQLQSGDNIVIGTTRINVAFWK